MNRVEIRERAASIRRFRLLVVISDISFRKRFFTLHPGNHGTFRPCFDVHVWIEVDTWASKQALRELYCKSPT